METNLIKLKKSEEVSTKLQNRTKNKAKEFNEVIFKRVGRVKKPTKTFHQNLSYDFLQYIRIIFKWACSNYEISRPHLELLLGIYPLGVFKKAEFEIFCRTIDMNSKRLFTTMVEDGWIKLWRPYKRGQSALYCLTTKGKVMCGKIHKMCLGESKIPEYKYGNALMTSGKAVDKFYMEAIKKMNQRKIEDAKDVVDEE